MWILQYCNFIDLDLEELLCDLDGDTEAIHGVEHGGVCGAGVGVSIGQPGVERAWGESEAWAWRVERHSLEVTWAQSCSVQRRTGGRGQVTMRYLETGANNSGGGEIVW